MKTNQSVHKVSVTSIPTHWRAHLDEYCGIWQLHRFGERSFPGVSRAEIVILKECPGFYPATSLPVGIGGGDFDEHRADGRLENSCAAVLVSNRLGNRNVPNLLPLIEEVLFADTTPKVGHTQLANMVKILHRVRKGFNQIGTYHWVADALDAVVFGKLDQEFDIRSEWAHFSECRGIEESWAVQFTAVSKYLQESDNRRKAFVTELSRIGAMMDPKLRTKWLSVAFESLVADNQSFEASIAEVNKRAKVIEVPCCGGDEVVTLLESENEHAKNAAFSSRTGKTTVFVIKNPATGHIQCFADPNRKAKLSGLATMARMAEYRKRHGRKLPLGEAMGKGNVEACPYWFLHGDTLLMNGSLTQPLVPASALTLDEFEPLLMVAFEPKLRDRWFKDYMSESSQPEAGTVAFTGPTIDAKAVHQLEAAFKQ